MLKLSEIDSYLASSRAYIEDAKRRIAGMGFCCPTMFLGNLESRQLELERMAWTERTRNGEMGYFWLIAGAVTAIGAIGTYVYDHYLKTKAQSEYYTCLEEAGKRGMNAADAKSYCTGGGGSDVAKTIQIVVYGSVALLALFIVYKFVGKKKK